MTKTLLTSALILGSAVASQAAVIYVVDAEGGANAFNTYDMSTGGDTAAGLSGSFAQDASNFVTNNEDQDYWGIQDAGFLTANGGTATWTVNGFTAGQTVNVYAHWREDAQGNADTLASYSVNGGTAVVYDQTTGAGSFAADLTLNDTITGDPVATDLSFHLIGTALVDGTGQVQAIMTRGANFAEMDAVAFVVVPEPSSAALLGLGGLALILRRRK